MFCFRDHILLHGILGRWLRFSWCDLTLAASLELVTHYLWSVCTYKMNGLPQLLPLEMSGYLNKEAGSGFVTWAADQQFVCSGCMEESERDMGEAGLSPLLLQSSRKKGLQNAYLQLWQRTVLPMAWREVLSCAAAPVPDPKLGKEPRTRQHLSLEAKA